MKWFEKIEEAIATLEEVRDYLDNKSVIMQSEAAADRWEMRADAVNEAIETLERIEK